MCVGLGLLTLSQKRVIGALKKNEREGDGETVGGGRKERDRGSNLWGVSPMPDEIHHSFDEERP